jgi:hypothetical protein
MTVFYLLLVEANPAKQDSLTLPVKGSQPKKGMPSIAKSSIATTKKEEKEASNGAATTVEPETILSSPKEDLNGFGASLHIDIQIHISSDASADQIDHIFASMAKHLYKGRNVNE